MVPKINDCFSNIDFTTLRHDGAQQQQASFLTPDFMGETVKPPPAKNDFVEKLFARGTNEVQIQQVNEPLMIIPGRFPQKEFDIEKLQEKFVAPVAKEEEEVVDAKAAKGGKKKPAANEKVVAEEPIEKEDTLEYHENQQILFGAHNSEKPSVMPEYFPIIHLVEDTVQINPNEYFDYPSLDAYNHPRDSTKVNEEKIRVHKTMDRSKKLYMTTKIVIAWKNNIFFECYELQKPCAENLPVQYTKNFLFFSRYCTSGIWQKYNTEIAKQVSATKENPETAHLESKTFEKILFYPIKCTAVTSKNIYLAIGCLDGTIILWDLQ